MDELAETNRRVGLITELSDRQESIQALIDAAREVDDKTLEEGLVANAGYEDDVVIAVVLAQKEVQANPDWEVQNFDVMIAGALLDDLDTLGYEVRRKKTKKL